MNKLFITIALCVSLIMVSGNAFADSTSSQVNGVEAGASVQTNDNSTNNVYNRTFPGVGITPIPLTNGFFTAPTPDSSFRSIKDVLRSFNGDGTYIMRMSEGALEGLAKGGESNTNLQIFRGADQVPRIYNADFDDDIKNPRWLWIGIEAPVIVNGNLVGTQRLDGLKVTGMIDGEADDGGTNSLQVMGIAGLKALNDDNNFMIYTAEGAHRKVEANGWGIGFYTSGGFVSDSGKQGVSPGGGTGYAQNETGTEDRPWFQGYVGCKDMQFLTDQINAFEASKVKPAVKTSKAKAPVVKKTTVAEVAPKPQTGNHMN